jgi:thiosulfate dehydrogenase
MNGTNRIAPRIALVAGLLLGLCGYAAAAEPLDPLHASIQRGSHMFATDTFGGKGMTCQSCHADGGRKPVHRGDGDPLPSLTNAAAIFPRFSGRADKMVTLENQIQMCISGGMGGKPLAYGSMEMTDMVSYLASLAHGQPMQMGGKPK